MKARLFSKTGQLTGSSFEFNDEATIGKGAENTIKLFPAPISGKHAHIYFDKKANAFFLEDLKSRNGTWLDGMRVTGKERLDKLSVITFAKLFDFVFQVVDSSVSNIVEPKKPMVVEKPTKQPEAKTMINADFAPMPELGAVLSPPKPTPVDSGKTVIGADFGMLPQLPSQPVAAGQKTVIGDNFIAPPKLGETPKVSPPMSTGAPTFVLEFKDVKGQARSFTLKEGENAVGRGDSCEIQIEDASLSRTHAVVTLRAGKVMVKDLGSKNHTLVDNKRIVSEVEVAPGIDVVFGIVAATLVKK